MIILCTELLQFHTALLSTFLTIRLDPSSRVPSCWSAAVDAGPERYVLVLRDNLVNILWRTVIVPLVGTELLLDLSHPVGTEQFPTTSLQQRFLNLLAHLNAESMPPPLVHSVQLVIVWDPEQDLQDLVVPELQNIASEILPLVRHDCLVSVLAVADLCRFSPQPFYFLDDPPVVVFQTCPPVPRIQEREPQAEIHRSWNVAKPFPFESQPSLEHFPLTVWHFNLPPNSVLHCHNNDASHHYIL